MRSGGESELVGRELVALLGNEKDRDLEEKYVSTIMYA